jgi:DNA polymerase I-like protein with 3'-5' exonuclease and polymerase domains
MNQININDYNIIHGVPPELDKTHRVAIDTEFSQMDKKRLHRPTGVFSCATFYFGGKDVYIVEDIRDLAQAFYNVEQAGWVFHNAAFDLFHLRRYLVIPKRKMIWDTQLVEQVRYSGKFTEFNLAACCRRNLDLLLEKEARETFIEHTGEMTQSQVEYACIDPVATHQLFLSQRSQIDSDDLKVWKDVELDYMWVIIGKSGMPINVEGWRNNASENLRISQERQAKYGQKVNKISEKTGKPLKSLVWEGMNLGSNPQVLAKLQSLGFNVESTGKKILAQLEDDLDGEVIDGTEHEFVRDLLDFRKFSKRASTYGQGWLDDYLETDNCVYPGIFQREAETTRSSSRNPNGQNIPNRDTKEFRKCFIAGDGWKLVDADYSSQEPRIAAEMSQDEGLIALFHSGKDIYVAIAEIAFHEIIEKKSDRRNAVKALVLGVFYGKTRFGLAKDLKISEEEAQGMIDDFYKAFPKVKTNYVDKMEEFAKEHEYVPSMSGSKLWVNTYGSQWKRNAVNSPIQGTAAEMVKLAVSRFTKEWNGENFYNNLAFILPVHDEILIRVKEDEAERAKDCLEKHMLQVAAEFHPSVPASVEIGIADNWAEAHG